MEIVEFDNAVLYLCDSRDIVGQIKADALIADPPYGISLSKMVGGHRANYKRWRYQSTRSEYYRVEGDDKPFEPAPFLGFDKVVLWGANHYASRLPDARCWLTWDKREGTPSDNQADCELAWTNLKGPARLIRHLWRGMLRRGEGNVRRAYRQHPMQKPVAVMEWCINLCKLKQGSTVFDPFMGSASTGVAAVRNGHYFIGCEIDPRWFKTACKRIEQAITAPKMLLED